MKSFGMRYLYRNLSQALKEMPFYITFHKKKVAKVTKIKEKK